MIELLKISEDEQTEKELHRECKRRKKVEESTKPRCYGCEGVLRENVNSVTCHQCSELYHAKCTNLKGKSKNFISSLGDWVCESCIV